MMSHAVSEGPNEFTALSLRRERQQLESSLEFKCFHTQLHTGGGVNEGGNESLKQDPQKFFLNLYIKCNKMQKGLTPLFNFLTTTVTPYPEFLEKHPKPSPLDFLPVCFFAFPTFFQFENISKWNFI